MIEVYKHTHGAYTVNETLLPQDQGHVTRGHEFKLEKRFCRTATRQNFFSFRVVESWNRLPPSVVSAPSLNAFKARLDRAWTDHMYKTDLTLPLSPNKFSLEISSQAEIQPTGH